MNIITSKNHFPPYWHAHCQRTPPPPPPPNPTAATYFLAPNFTTNFAVTVVLPAPALSCKRCPRAILPHASSILPRPRLGNPIHNVYKFRYQVSFTSNVVNHTDEGSATILCNL
jgi:hypothetical protein